eukprot:TRINITY_DN15247_c0_g1_i1.p1 TRINITY_DN15247_c0_g1~~TRINITY_DN15247_c0_g1_i1.p1  ORF type:complete len:495 (-),score=97.11 TRINITY_DN15247_c0_g1_i1:38-1384(-)
MAAAMSKFMIVHRGFKKDRTPVKHVKTAEEAVQLVKSNDRIYIHSVAAAPQPLIDAVTARSNELRGVELCHIHIEATTPYSAPGLQESFRTRNLFVGPNQREAVHEGRSDFVPVFLSEVSVLFRRGIIPLDVALLSVSPPDEHGYVTLGPSIDCSMAAARSAKHVIAMVNNHLPRTYGDGVAHIDQLDVVWEHNAPLPQARQRPLAEDEKAIGKHIADLIDDGSTLQMGIGGIPDATLGYLHGHKDLGIHTEMFAEGVIDLIEKGIVTNKYKKILPGRILGSFVMGTERLYKFIDNNPLIEMRDSEYVNNPFNIAQNPKVCAINACIEIDLTGQVCSDSISTRHFSGIGGQMDFERGAALSEGGKPFISLPSVTKGGASRIVPVLKEGAGVVTTRGHVHWVVTEYGARFLFGLSFRERAQALIDIAHPTHREWLAFEAKKRFKTEFKY